jgi:hypothetical protein
VTDALTTDRLEVVHTLPDIPAARCYVADGGVSVSVGSPGGLRLLVAADAGRYSLMLARTFRQVASSAAPILDVAEALDETLQRVGQHSVCATLVDVSHDGLVALHRGGPTPLVIHHDRTLTRILASLPGPPLAPTDRSATVGHVESIPSAPGDVLLVTTPGAVEAGLHAIAAATTPTLGALAQAMRDAGPLETGSAYAVVALSPAAQRAA